MAVAVSGVVAAAMNVFKMAPHNLLVPCVTAGINKQFVRYGSSKHWNPKFKRLRALKVIKVELPRFNEDPSKYSEEEIRSKMKERGVLPIRPWMERPVNISCTGAVFEAYVPPEGDGKMSAISTTGAKQKMEFLEKKSKSMMAVRKIRTFDEDFKTQLFAEAAQDIYIQTHTHMMSKDKYKLREVVTERAYPEIMHNIRHTTIHWKFLQSLEPPRVVHARCTDIITRDNIFAQITVRFHSQQVLAVYDRFGRLMHGSEILAKDVLEYVVFEKHLSNQYGVWRLHAKIIPDWMPPREPSLKTFIQQEIPISSDTESDSETESASEVVVADSEKRKETSNVNVAH